MEKDILSEDDSRFYIAETILAVESVHNLNYIHRDLKPDNLLIGKDGHVKLSDFGLCKHVEIKSKSNNVYENLRKDLTGVASQEEYKSGMNKQLFNRRTDYKRSR
jgi:serine/threonine kinase 38